MTQTGLKKKQILLRRPAANAKLSTESQLVLHYLRLKPYSTVKQLGELIARTDSSSLTFCETKRMACPCCTANRLGQILPALARRGYVVLTREGWLAG